LIDKTRRDSKSVAANRFDTSFFSTSSIESKEDPLNLELSAFNRFIDSSNKKRSDPMGPMKVIKSRLEAKKINLHKFTNSSLAAQFKGKSIVEWNKYVSNEDKSGTAEDFSHFYFHDRNLYKMYLQLADKRGNLK